MVRRFAAALFAWLLSATVTLAQQIEAQPLMPLSPAVETTQPPVAAPRPATAAPMPAPASPPIGRVFCEQPVAVQLADRDAVAERFQPFIGIWSDASWTPFLCAALVVENVAPDGTATILYVFGPMGASGRAAGGILHGTGIIHDGELRFQNSDGSQFAFRPLYADLAGRLVTPKGQTYQAAFKKTP